MSCELKLDGMSLALALREWQTVSRYHQWRRDYREDVTPELCPRVRSIPSFISAGHAGESRNPRRPFEVRGEMLMPIAAFKK